MDLSDRIGYGHPKDPEILTSAEEWDSFISSYVWVDMSVFLTERLENINLDLITVENDRELGKLQGEAKSIRDMLLLPEFLKNQHTLAHSVENDE